MKIKNSVASTVIRTSLLLFCLVPGALFSQSEEGKSAPAAIASVSSSANKVSPPGSTSAVAIPVTPGSAQAPTQPELELVINNNPSHIPTYDAIIQSSLKERERRLGLLNEALIRLRDAGEIGIARRVEARIQALVEMPDAEQTDPVLEQMAELARKNETLKAEVKEQASKTEKSKSEAAEEIKSTSTRRSR